MRWALASLLVCVSAFGADWKRGRHIYLHGAGTAIVNGSAELPAASLPCGSCHGPDGRGVSEGTIVPADVRWKALSRRYYDDATLRRAVTAGLDRMENRLSPVMPRYRMDDADLADLIAYLRRLGEAPDPGLSASEIAVATGAPAHAPLIRAYFDDINRAGGIYGRTLRLVEADEEAFAMLSGTGGDPDERMPVLAPFPSGAPSSASFFLYADLPTQALALTKAIDGPREVYVAHDHSEEARAAAEALSREGWTVRELDDCCKPDDILFLLGRVDPSALARRFEKLQQRPRVLFATPSVPADVTPEGLEELQAFATRHGLPRTNLPAQIASYATVKVFVEGLKRAGRELTREKLIAALEQLYRFPTGLTPPVTFNRNRRVGSDGYVVALSSPATP
ncbi:MAG TPA: ABC transporter substrate-binding protein [Thermoanaerobaculia bacterium]